MWRIVERCPSVHPVVEARSSYFVRGREYKDTLEVSCSCKILWWLGLLEHKYCGDQGCWNTNTVVIRVAGTRTLWWSGLLEHKYCGDQDSWNTNTLVIRVAGTRILWWSGLLEHKYGGDQGCWNTNTVVIRVAGTQIRWWSGLLEHKYCGNQDCWNIYFGEQGCANTNTVVNRSVETQVLWWSGQIINTNIVVVRAALTWTPLLTLRIGLLFPLHPHRMLILPSYLGSANVSFFFVQSFVPHLVKAMFPSLCVMLF